MVNQIIKKYVDIFDDFVKENFNYEQDQYVYNILIFKKLIYNEKVEGFLKELENYYYKNKHFYLTRLPINYNTFNTILRQIMKKNNIIYEKNIKYINSKYSVEYKIKL